MPEEIKLNIDGDIGARSKESEKLDTRDVTETGRVQGSPTDTVSDPFDLAELNAALENTPYKDNLHYFPTIGSTNTFAMREADAGGPEGSVYFADEQTSGRGRGGHHWYSAPGSGLYVSVLLRPRLAPADAQWFSLAAGLAVRDAVLDVTRTAGEPLHADLRWPNDLLLGGRKFCGILAELHAEASQVRHLVIGIGINVHQEHFPAELSSLATSLRIESGRSCRRQLLLLALLNALDRETRALADPEALSQTKAALPGRVEAVSTWVRGKQVIVGEDSKDGCFRGITAGLDERGFLLVETPEGTRTVLSGGVRADQSSLPD